MGSGRIVRTGLGSLCLKTGAEFTQMAGGSKPGAEPGATKRAPY